MATYPVVCWCGQPYVRGVCPIHGVMSAPGAETEVKSLRYASNALLANVQLPASAPTFYDGPTVTLSPGTWMVSFHVTFSRSTTTAVSYLARITDKTSVFAAGQQYHPSVANHFVQMSMTTIASVQTATQIWGQGATTAGSSGSYMRYALSTTTWGAGSTQLTAVRLG
jgi:hypothetical protein